MQDATEAAQAEPEFIGGTSGEDAAPETETPAVEATEAEGEAGEGTETEPGDEQADDLEKPKQTPWFQRRIDDLTREKWEARRAADELKAEVERLKAGTQDEGEQGQRQKPQEDVETVAARIVAQREFDAQCNTAYEKGKGAFPDFDEAMTNFRLVGGLSPSLVEAALEAAGPDGAHKVLYQLGKDPEQAERILKMPPIRMAAAVAKMAVSAPKAAPISKAPAPPKPITGATRSDPSPDKMTTSEWMAWRDKQTADARR